MSFIQKKWFPIAVVGGLIGISWIAGKKFDEQERKGNPFLYGEIDEAITDVAIDDVLDAETFNADDKSLPDCCIPPNDPFNTAMLWREDGVSDEEVVWLWNIQKPVIEKVIKKYGTDPKICMFPFYEGGYDYKYIFGDYYAINKKNEFVEPLSIAEDVEDKVLGSVPKGLLNQIDELKMVQGWGNDWLEEEARRDYPPFGAETFNADEEKRKEVNRYRIGDMKVREYDDGSFERFEAQGYKGISASKIKILEHYIQNGGTALDYHELPYHIQRQLEMGRVHELLYQSVNRWLWDNAPNPHHTMPSWLSAESFNALSFKQWSDDEMHEPKHGGSHMEFDDWLDDEIKSHGDIPLSEWGYEEEHDEKEHQHSAESFETIIEKIDKEYSENGITSDATDIYYELIKRHGADKKDQIKRDLEAFYQTELELDAESFKDKTLLRSNYTDGDGFTWRLVSQKYAKQNWRNEEIYWLDTSDDTESLIDEDNYETYTSPDFSDELFGIGIGFEAETYSKKDYQFWGAEYSEGSVDVWLSGPVPMSVVNQGEKAIIDYLWSEGTIPEDETWPEDTGDDWDYNYDTLQRYEDMEYGWDAKMQEAETFNAEKPLMSTVTLPKKKKWTHRKWFINQKKGDKYYYEDDVVKYLAKHYGRWNLDIKPRYKNRNLAEMFDDLGLTGYQKSSAVIDAAIAQDKLQYLRLRDPEGQGTETRPRVIKKIIQVWDAKMQEAETFDAEEKSYVLRFSDPMRGGKLVELPFLTYEEVQEYIEKNIAPYNANKPFNRQISTQIIFPPEEYEILNEMGLPKPKFDAETMTDRFAKRFPDHKILRDRKGMMAKFRKSQLDDRDWVGWVQLTGYGKSPCILASDLKVGDHIVYNSGASAEIVAIKPKGKASLTVSSISEHDGKTYDRDYRKSSWVPILMEWQAKRRMR